MAMRLFDNEHYLSLEEVNEGQMLDHVPAMVYRLQCLQGPMSPPQWRLVKDRKSYAVAERRYGEHAIRLKYLTSNYDPTMPSVGVLCVGRAGSGKSFLCEDLCNWALGRGMPVLLVTHAWPADVIKNFAKLMGPCVVYFDEFEKNYPIHDEERPSQEDLLPFFSDTDLPGRIMLMTANEMDRVCDYLLDRPQRVRYRIDFGSLTTQDIDELAHTLALSGWRLEQLQRINASTYMSWDTARCIGDILRNAESVEEAKFALRLGNTPEWKYLEPLITEVVYCGEEWPGEQIRARMFSDETLEVAVLDEDGKVLINCHFSLKDASIMGEKAHSPSELYMNAMRADAGLGQGGRASGTTGDSSPGKYAFVKPHPDMRMSIRLGLSGVDFFPEEGHLVSVMCSTREQLKYIKEQTANKPEAKCSEEAPATHEMTSYGRERGQTSSCATVEETALSPPLEFRSSVVVNSSLFQGNPNTDLAKEVAKAALRSKPLS